MTTAFNSLRRFVPLARATFAACLAALGVIHVISGEAVTRLFPRWPEGLPGRPYWAHVAGVALAIFGGMALLRLRPRTALALIGGLILLSVVALHLPRSIPSNSFGDEWLNVFKWLAMAAGAFLMAGTCPTEDGGSALDRLIRVFAAIAKWALAAFMIGAAILHFRFGAFVQFLIPEIIPWRLFWTYFAGASLAAGGVGLLIPRTARLAALLTSLMIFLWCPLVHIPRTFAEPRNPGEWCGVFESLAFAAMAFLLAVRLGDKSIPDGRISE